MGVTVSEFAALMQGLGAIAGVGAVFYAAHKAANTFSSWRNQKIVERHIDQAEKILIATYRVQRALSSVRAPMMLAHEIGMAQEILDQKKVWETVPEENRANVRHAQVYHSRLGRIEDDQRLLFDHIPVARALFGNDLEKHMSELGRKFQEVWFAVDDLMRLRPDDPIEARNLVNETLSFRAISGKPNEMTLAIDGLVKKIEDVCLPIIRSEAKKTNWWGLESKRQG